MHSKRAIIIFLSIILFVLFLTNVVVYEAISHIFSLESSAAICLGALLFIFSFGFILITILGRRYYTIFTRSITRVLSMYMGIFVYLFLTSIVYGIFILFDTSQGTIVGELLMIFAVLLGIYGFFHARKICVTRITFPLGLPEWKNRRAVFVSDLHLGQVLGQSFAWKVVDAIRALEPDIVFIGGDLFDGTTAPNLDTLLLPFRELHAPLGIYFVTGNHEEFGDDSPFLDAIARSGITILSDKKIEIDSLQIIGVDDETSDDRTNFSHTLAELHIERSKPSLLLRHQPKDLDVAEAAGVRFQMSGHTHKAQQWPLEYIASWAFKGYAYGLKDFKSMQVYTSSGVGTWGPPVRVGTKSEIVLVSFK